MEGLRPELLMEEGEEEREVEAAFPEEKREEALPRPPGRAERMACLESSRGSRPGAEWVWKWSGLRRQLRTLWPGC